MRTITLNNAVSSLPEIIAMTIKNQEETVIATDDGAVVMIDQNNWEGMVESLNLLQDKISLKALLEGHQNKIKGKRKGKTIKQVFNDLQDIDS